MRMYSRRPLLEEPFAQTLSGIIQKHMGVYYCFLGIRISRTISQQPSKLLRISQRLCYDSKRSLLCWERHFQFAEGRVGIPRVFRSKKMCGEMANPMWAPVATSWDLLLFESPNSLTMASTFQMLLKCVVKIQWSDFYRFFSGLPWFTMVYPFIILSGFKTVSFTDRFSMRWWFPKVPSWIWRATALLHSTPPPLGALAGWSSAPRNRELEFMLGCYDC